MTTMKDVLALVKPFDQYDSKDLQDSNMEHFESDLQTGTWIGWDQQWDDRVKMVAINEWLCTDTMVGLYAHFFDREFIALSFQEGRKCDCHIFWKSKADSKKVQEFILSIKGEEENYISIINEDHVIGDHWLEPQ